VSKIRKYNSIHGTESFLKS